MSVQLKYGDEWLEAEEALSRRRREAMNPQPAAPVDVAALPKGMGLNAMGIQCPAVRRYINANCQMRSGLTPEEQETARKILGRYVNADGEMCSGLNAEEQETARKILGRCGGPA